VNTENETFDLFEEMGKLISTHTIFCWRW